MPSAGTGQPSLLFNMPPPNALLDLTEKPTFTVPHTTPQSCTAEEVKVLICIYKRWGT